jgi:hypothetical protein
MLESVEIGAPISYRNLHVYPLFGDTVADRGYVTLDDARETGSVRLLEVSEKGAVPSVRVVSDADMPVFLLDGQELVGAMQDRVLNVSVLASARSTIQVPVSCVEAARWDPETPEFAPAGQVHFATGRAERIAQVTRSLSETGEAASDQVDIWAAIDARLRYMGVVSPTCAHAALFAEARRRLDKFVEAVRPRDGQTGALFAVGAEIAGLDLFDSAETLAANLPKLVRSAALDALVSPSGAAPSRCEAIRFVHRVRAARTLRFAAVGEGEDIRLCGAMLSGGALAWRGRVVHLCAFALDEDP